MLKFRQTPLERFRKFHEARDVPVLNKILADNIEFFSSLNDADAEEFRPLRRDLDDWRTIEASHGPGAVLDLDHPMIMRFLRNHRHIRELPEEHICNALVFRASKREIAHRPSD